jgi:hypothetical protein
LTSKEDKMKLSKLLLSAIVAGVAVTATTTSCSKKDKEVAPQTNEEKTGDVKPTVMPYDCPACGMG